MALLTRSLKMAAFSSIQQTVQDTGGLVTSTRETDISNYLKAPQFEQKYSHTIPFNSVSSISTMVNLINNTHKGKMLNQVGGDSYRFQIHATQLWVANLHFKKLNVNYFVKFQKSKHMLCSSSQYSSSFTKFWLDACQIQENYSISYGLKKRLINIPI